MSNKIEFKEFLKIIQRLTHEPETLQETMQSISDGKIAVDAQTRSFLAESCMALHSLRSNSSDGDDEGTLSHNYSLILYRDGENFTEFIWPLKSKNTEILEVTPANYKFETSSGLLLWQYELNDYDLIISKMAKKEGKFRMAADSGDYHLNRTITNELGHGAMQINVYAGVVAGRIEIVFNTYES